MELKFLKKIICFVRLFNMTLFSLFKIIHFSCRFPKIKRIKSNIHSECYILGNGPSLKDDLITHLDYLKSRELFVVNDFAKSKYFELVKPKYYVFLDPCYWNQKVFIDFFDDGLLVLKSIRDNVDWPIYLLIPNEAYKTNKFQVFFCSNNNVSIVNYNSTSVKGFKKFRFFVYKNYFGMPPVNNVVGASIFIAINMLYKEINILGVDHSWTKDLIVNDFNQVCYENPHFYDEVVSEHIPVRTVYGDYYSMHQLIRDYATMFEGYHILKEYSEFRGVNIINRCKKSFIDAFVRKEFI